MERISEWLGSNISCDIDIIVTAPQVVIQHHQKANQ